MLVTPIFLRHWTFFTGCGRLPPSYRFDKLQMRRAMGEKAELERAEWEKRREAGALATAPEETGHFSTGTKV